jgi:gas vesicle protein
MNTGKVVIGVIAGVAAGAILGMLFAPDKGSETRNKIAKKTTDTSDDIKEKFEELLSSINEKFDMLKEETADLMEKGKHKVDEFSNNVKKERV